MNIIEEISKVYNDNKNIILFLDMDGTIIELLFNSEESFRKKDEYMKKKPIKPIIEIIKKINIQFPLIKINILSYSQTNEMIKAKDEWLNKYLQDIKLNDRIFLCEETGDYTQENINYIKSQYIKNNLKENEIAILIDDDIRILLAAKEILKDRILPYHVTSLLI